MRRDSVLLFYFQNNRIDSAVSDVFLIKEFNQEIVLDYLHL